MARVWKLLRLGSTKPASKSVRVASPKAIDSAEHNDLDFQFVKSQGEDLGIGAQGKVTAVYNDKEEVCLRHKRSFAFGYALTSYI
jgi:glyoxylate carboligase